MQRMIDVTTADVVARPTPSGPPSTDSPRYEPTTAMMTANAAGVARTELALRFGGELGLVVKFRVEAVEIEQRVGVGDHEADERRDAPDQQADDAQHDRSRDRGYGIARGDHMAAGLQHPHRFRAEGGKGREAAQHARALDDEVDLRHRRVVHDGVAGRRGRTEGAVDADLVSADIGDANRRITDPIFWQLVDEGFDGRGRDVDGRRRRRLRNSRHCRRQDSDKHERGTSHHDVLLEWLWRQHPSSSTASPALTVPLTRSYGSEAMEPASDRRQISSPEHGQAPHLTDFGATS